MMIPSSLRIMPKQAKRIASALRRRKGCKIRVKKCSGGANQLLLAPGHLKKYQKAAVGRVMSLPFTHKQLVENHKGGFLSLLAALLGPILGGVAGGLLSGHGLKIGKKKRKKMTSRGMTKKKNGTGMYLNPWNGGAGGGRRSR